ncbi:MAG: ATP-binding cassette domain-containing protein [Chloroflexi bacterium]|nr:ATP-binding cassette domain-containing protein [Chloroflexota bacterium]
MDVAIEQLTRTFGGVRANDGITLQFAAGQIHGVLGENGAGKSTLMKVLAGFIRRDSGEIRLAGAPVELGTPAAAARAGIGMVHQEPLDVPAFTALENFLCGSDPVVFGDWRAARARLIEWNARLGFSVDPAERTGRMTVGQRQQLELMRLLTAGARLLILDEPTTGISAAQVDALFAALRQLAASGRTVLFVSHKLDEVAALCDTVSVLRAGRLQPPGQLAMPQPQAALLRAMFGEALAQPDAVATAQPAAAGAAVWHLDDATVRDGVLALERMTLTIPAGMAVGLAGLEGSGQQLMLRLLAGAVRPVSGRVMSGGRDLGGAGMAQARARGIEYLPADRLSAGLIGSFDLGEHLELLAPRRWWRDRVAARAAAGRAIATFDIRGTPATPLQALSGGNQQRAMLALMPDTLRGLLLDQPTRGLDVASARLVWQRIAERRRGGTAVVFASVDLDELLEHADALLVFVGGRVSRLIPRAQLDAPRLARLIGGIGFEEAR